MLPERLCNNICSLRPNEDKLTYSVIFHIDDKARVKYHQIAHTVINSNRRYTYEEVLEIQKSPKRPQALNRKRVEDLMQRLMNDGYKVAKQ